MRKFVIATAAALSLAAVPTAAFASKPVHTTDSTTVHTTHNEATTTTTEKKMPEPAKTHKTPVVMYVLRGPLSAYTPASSTANGTVSITVTGSNDEPKMLKGLTLVFATSTETKVELFGNKAVVSGDRGIVKVRATKNLDLTALQTEMAFQVIDQGVVKTSDSTTTTTQTRS